MALLSVIIPNYNHSTFLKQRIDSVLNQTYQGFELIILDDCSKDNSRDIIEHYRNHLKISIINFNSENSGSPFKQWQKGIELAKGEYVWIAESDDYADPDFLTTLMGALEKDSSIVLAYCNSIFINEHGEILEIPNNHLHNEKEGIYSNKGLEECKNYLFFRPIIPNASAVLFKKAAFININRNFLDYRICGDWWFWICISSQGNIVYYNQSLNYFRQTTTSASKSNSHVSNARKIFLMEKLKIANDLNRLIIPAPLSNKLQLLYKDWQIIIREVMKHEVRLSFKEFITMVRTSWQLTCTAPLCIIAAPLHLLYHTSKNAIGRLLNKKY